MAEESCAKARTRGWAFDKRRFHPRERLVLAVSAKRGASRTGDERVKRELASLRAFGELVASIPRIGFTGGPGRSKAGLDEARGRISGREPFACHLKTGMIDGFV